MTQAAVPFKPKRAAPGPWPQRGELPPSSSTVTSGLCGLLNSFAIKWATEADFQFLSQCGILRTLFDVIHLRTDPPPVIGRSSRKLALRMLDMIDAGPPRPRGYDSIVAKALAKDWPLEKLDPVLRALLRAAARLGFELVRRHTHTHTHILTCTRR